MKTKFKDTEIGKIPEDWDVEVFSNVIAINPKRDIKKGTTARKISMQNLIEFKRKIDGFELSEFKGGSKFQNGDTLMARITPCLENGKTAYVDLLEDNEIAFGSTEFIVLSGKDNLTRNDFVYYLAISPKIRRIAIQSMTGTSGRQRIQADLLGDVEIGIPSLEEQHRIAKILSDLDSKTELLQKQNKTLEATGQALFKHWFVDFEFPNEVGKPYKSSGGEMVFNEELGKEIPKRWEVSKIGTKLKVILGGTPDRTKKEYWDGDVNWINSGKVNEFRITEPSEKITKEGLEKSATKLLPKGTVVLAITGATLGQVSRLEIDSCANQSVIGILENDDLPSEYLFFWIKKTIDDIIRWQTGGAQQHINKGNVEISYILIPPSKIINEYLRIARSQFNKISINCFLSQNLSKIRDSLLPKLMSGKIRVPVEVE